MDSLFIFTTPVLHLPPLINISVPPVLLGMPWLLVITNAGRTDLYLQTAVQTKGWLISINTMRFIFFKTLTSFSSGYFLSLLSPPHPHLFSVQLGLQEYIKVYHWLSTSDANTDTKIIHVPPVES